MYLLKILIGPIQELRDLVGIVLLRRRRDLVHAAAVRNPFDETRQRKRLQQFDFSSWFAVGH